MTLWKIFNFWCNQTDIQALLSTDELVILTNFPDNGAKIVDFFTTNEFWAQSQISLKSLNLVNKTNFTFFIELSRKK